MIAALLPLAMQAAAPVVTGNGDWTVACDQQRRCTAWARVPADGDAVDYPLVLLRRDGAAAARAALDLPIPAATARGTSLTIQVDGRVMAKLVAPGGGAGLSLPFAGTLAAALEHGRSLTLVDARGGVRARTSLVGLSAALAAIDAAQQREGTRGALVRRGRATAVPPLPPVPVVVTPPVDARPPRELSRKQSIALFGKPTKACGSALSRGYRLDAANTLLAIEPSCGTPGAVTLAYVLPDEGDPRAATFDAPASLPGAVPHQLAGNWDPTQRRIAVLLPETPGRDCGTRRAFAWDGVAFRMVEERIVAECRRATYEVTTWRAEVRTSRAAQ